MLADTFPPAKRGAGLRRLRRGTVIVAPALGPTIGGSITDNISWHWIFFINVPMGLLSLAVVYLFVDEPETLRRERAEHLRGGLKVDWIGFVLVALCLGFLEIVLDKGRRTIGSTRHSSFAPPPSPASPSCCSFPGRSPARSRSSTSASSPTGSSAPPGS